MVAIVRAQQVDSTTACICPLTQVELERILERGITDGCFQATLRDAFGRVYARSGSQLEIVPHQAGPSPRSITVRAVVTVHDTVMASIEVIGSRENRTMLAQTARLLASQIADAWTWVEESESLASEILRVYEELHLLYELGDTLTSQLSSEQVVDLILEKILKTLRAARAELRLSDPDRTVYSKSALPARPASLLQTDGEHHLSTLLRSGGHVTGSLDLLRSTNSAPFSAGDRKLLDAIGAFAGSVIRNAQLRHQVDTDALTGLLNHRAIHQRLDRELALAADTEGVSTGVIILDIDDFKLFNDTYGHLVGDRVLRVMSNILKASCRSSDIVGRYGGDEFVVILPRTDWAGVEAVAERIVQMAETHQITIGNSTLIVGVSLGCSMYPNHATTKHQLLNHADEKLYEAKHRNECNVGLFQPLDTRSLVDSPSFGALQGLVNAVDAKDRYTSKHSEVVTIGAALLARRLGMSEEQCKSLQIAGLLHDVGKVGVPDDILRKPGPLTTDEYRIMQQHVSLSELIIKDVPGLECVLEAVANHHERYDGRGYPRQRSGEEIPLSGRIMAIADACAAMLVNRPYRSRLSWGKVVAELRNGKGTQFDPSLVEPFIEAMEQAMVNEEATLSGS